MSDQLIFSPGPQNLLGNFEHPQKSQGSKGRNTKTVSSGRVVDPPLFKQRATNHKAVEAVESRLEVSNQAKSIHPYTHLEYKKGEEHKFAVN